MCFDGDEKNFELWETKFLAHLRLQGLKGTILNEFDGDAIEGESAADRAARAAEDASKNEEAYAELIQLLDDKSLSLVMRDAADNGRKALKILRDHYAGKGKPRVISLYTELTSLQIAASETITDYIIRAETAITALRRAEEVLSDGLLIAMILKGLPESYKPFAIHITQSDEKITFAEFKTKLRSYESTERFGASSGDDSVMKVTGRGYEAKPAGLACWSCGQRGHRSRECSSAAGQREQSRWCSFCKSSTHKDANCRRRGRRDDAKRVVDDEDHDADNHTFVFRVGQVDSDCSGEVKQRGLMVDTGATSHIVTDERKFQHFDEHFEPRKHVLELADGVRASGIALKRGAAKVWLRDNTGREVETELAGALYVPSFPQDIFSVKAATSKGATVIFKEGQNKLIHKNGTTFDINVYDRLFYLNTINEGNVDECHGCYDVKTWHEILGHCNYEDVLKLPDVTEGMAIKGKTDLSNLTCEVCIEGKFAQSRSRKPDAKAKNALDLVHTDLAGPIDPTAKDGFRYTISFTDDYSGSVFVYFLKSKSDTVKATEKFIADVSPFGRIKCLRSDCGGEYTSSQFQTLLSKNAIRHETSAPYSPHQNGTAERNWRTLFEMARCMLLESNLPKRLWTYAVQTAAVIRNRCFNKRSGQTPYQMLTGKKPNLSKMRTFGSPCFAYKQDKKKLDSRCDKGIFVGYDKYSPAYLVFYPNTGKVVRQRLVKFITKVVSESQTQTEHNSEDEDVIMRRVSNPQPKHEKVEIPMVSQENTECVFGNDETDEGQSNQVTVTTAPFKKEYPKRERRPPQYLRDYECQVKSEDEEELTLDYCYRVICDVPKTLNQAMTSPNSELWSKAMKEEIDSLRENETFTLTTLPEGKHAVGGRWVYTIKENPVKTYKARYVAKGYSQVSGIDYTETFSPTANMTSVRSLMQIAVQHNLQVHQMDVKTAYLHAPIDCELYMEQPEGFEVKSETGEKLVCKLNKSLYGLKQSGRNWNKMLHDFLSENGFIQNPADHCVYSKDTSNGEKIIVIIWVDDLIIAGSNSQTIQNVKCILGSKFKMKDLGQLKHFLGIDFTQTDGEIKMSQKRYITKILQRFDMSACKARSTPCEYKLNFDNEGDLADQKRYREVVGSLIYVMTCTRPDLSYIVSKLSQHLSEPMEQHMVTAKHVLRYLRGTVEQEMCFKRSDSKLTLFSYCDADWAADQNDRRSTTGYCFGLCKTGPIISWKSKKQATVALSTCEAEYMALAAATQECLYLVQLLKGMDNDIDCVAPVTIFEDNQGAIALSKNPVSRQRCKHVDIKYHFVRSSVSDGKISIVYCPTTDMVADIFTKPVPRVTMERFMYFVFGVN